MMKEDNRRHFTGEFKRNAVQLVTEKGMPVGKVARELDIHPNLLPVNPGDLLGRAGCGNAARPDL